MEKVYEEKWIREDVLRRYSQKEEREKEEEKERERVGKGEGRREEGEERERDRDRAGAVEREPQIQENTKLMEYMQYIRDLVLMKRRCNISNSLATY